MRGVVQPSPRSLFVAPVALELTSLPTPSSSHRAKLQKLAPNKEHTFSSLAANAALLKEKYAGRRQNPFSYPASAGKAEHDFGILPIEDEASIYREEAKKGHGVPLSGELGYVVACSVAREGTSARAY